MIHDVNIGSLGLLAPRLQPQRPQLRLLHHRAMLVISVTFLPPSHLPKPLLHQQRTTGLARLQRQLLLVVLLLRVLVRIRL